MDGRTHEETLNNCSVGRCTVRRLWEVRKQFISNYGLTSVSTLYELVRGGVHERIYFI